MSRDIVRLRRRGVSRDIVRAPLDSGRAVRLLIDDDVLVTELGTGLILAEFTIDPARGYQAKKQGPGENRGPAS